MSKIYISCPYSDPDSLVRADRIRKATRAAARLFFHGHLVYSPLTHTASMHEYLPPHWDQKFKYWQKISLTFVEWADVLLQLKLPGWWESVGCREEIKHADKLGKDIVYAGEMEILTGKHPLCGGGDCIL